MTIQLNEGALRSQLKPLLDVAAFHQGVANLASDPFFLAFFLMSVSEGEGLGEAAVALIRQEELARLIHDLKRQEAEERGHKERTRRAAQDLFPEFFEGARYRYDAALHGEPYYRTVLEANRARLKERNRYSRLNLYLTTTFGYEIMVLLLYSAVAEAVGSSALPRPVRERVHALLDGILREEATHLGVVEQHNALLAADPSRFSREACSMLETLGALTAEDYTFAADLSVREVVRMMGRYGDPERYRAEIEAARPARV